MGSETLRHGARTRTRADGLVTTHGKARSRMKQHSMGMSMRLVVLKGRWHTVWDLPSAWCAAPGNTAPIPRAQEQVLMNSPFPRLMVTRSTLLRQ